MESLIYAREEAGCVRHKWDQDEADEWLGDVELLFYLFDRRDHLEMNVSTAITGATLKTGATYSNLHNTLYQLCRGECCDGRS